MVDVMVRFWDPCLESPADCTMREREGLHYAFLEAIMIKHARMNHQIRSHQRFSVNYSLYLERYLEVPDDREDDTTEMARCCWRSADSSANDFRMENHEIEDSNQCTDAVPSRTVQGRWLALGSLRGMAKEDSDAECSYEEGLEEEESGEE